MPPLCLPQCFSSQIAKSVRNRLGRVALICDWDKFFSTATPVSDMLPVGISARQRKKATVIMQSRLSEQDLAYVEPQITGLGFTLGRRCCTYPGMKYKRRARNA
jgi:hypothetical protein